MSKYTTEVRYICEQEAGLSASVGFDDIWNVLSDTTVEKVFKNITFPIFDEAYRVPLEKKILLHFYTREIGFETVGLWKLKLTSKLQDIMPYYNQLYQSAKDAAGLDFFNSTDYSIVMNGTTQDVETLLKGIGKTTTHSGKDIAKQTQDLNTTTDTNASGRTINADTPQSKINDIELADTNVFASEYEKTKDTTNKTEATTGTVSIENSYDSSIKETNTGTDKTTRDSTDNNTKTVRGRDGETAASILKEMRTTFINIDQMIIEELSPLFMSLW